MWLTGSLSGEFCSLLADLDERYPLPGQAAIMTEMDKLLVDLKGKLMSCLNDARKVALCVDVWSRKGMTASYLGITAHFFTRSDHKRHTATIAVRRLPSPHTAERVERVVDEVLTEWQIPQTKISAISTDNGSNMIAAFRDWLSELQSESDHEDGDEDPRSGRAPLVMTMASGMM